jgi:hypothetical protein
VRLSFGSSDQGLDLPDVAPDQSPQLAQLAPRVLPELIAARRIVYLVLQNACEPCDDTEHGTALDQRAL